jgi:hypothetical protein
MKASSARAQLDGGVVVRALMERRLVREERRMAENRDPIEYLLNAMEEAKESDNPAANNYGAKRRAVLAAVAELRKENRTLWSALRTLARNGGSQ